MDQTPSNEDYPLEIVGNDQQNASAESQAPQAQINQQQEVQESNADLDQSTFQDPPCDNSMNYTANLLYDESDKIHPPPTFERDPPERVAIESIEEVENLEFNKDDVSNISNSEVIGLTSQNDDATIQESYIQSNEQTISSAIPSSKAHEETNDYFNQNEHHYINNPNKNNESFDEIHQDSMQALSSQEDDPIQVTAQDQETISAIKSSQLPQTTEHKTIRHDPLLDLDIPRPVFSSDDENQNEPIQNLSNSLSPIDLDTISKTSHEESPLNNCQPMISNQSFQRVDAPSFIPSSQIAMTKQALEEGNSFLKVILSKLRNINQYLSEKTSKVFS